MEFRIKTDGSRPDLDTIHDALTTIDPSALADLEPATAILRVSVALGAHDLLALLKQAGYPIDRGQLEAVAPSAVAVAAGSIASLPPSTSGAVSGSLHVAFVHVAAAGMLHGNAVVIQLSTKIRLVERLLADGYTVEQNI